MMDWEQIWLNYQYVKNQSNSNYFQTIAITFNGETSKNAYKFDEVMIENVKKELILSSQRFFSIEPLFIVDGTYATLLMILDTNSDIPFEGYRIKEVAKQLQISASSAQGLLYGAFAVIRRVMCDENLASIDIVSAPDKTFRMLNHWDNPDGSVERGYSGNSIFLKDGELLNNERIRDYSRLISSIGINASVINNVNVKDQAVAFISEKYLYKIKEIADIFGSYGIKLFLSLDFAAPIDLGGLDTADPLDDSVIKWWKERMQLVYAIIPHLGGFLVKADSEGRPGPFMYKRNQADGANVLAQAIKPFDGVIIWRCFVYNSQQDWRDTTTDRARSAYDYFYDLDGKFSDNVILQIKNGPIDFQIREPFMPLFGKLKKTRYLMEVQIAQEYTGQQIDICYLIPWFQEILQMRTYCTQKNDTIASLLSPAPQSGGGEGIVAVSNIGDDTNWTGHDLAAINLYGFGRLSWNSDIQNDQILSEWCKMTFSPKKKVLDTITTILMMSHPALEKYSAPLGVGFMVTPHYHYAPNIDGYEYDKWGTYHRADHKGIGNDRTDCGTGYASLYYEPLANIYNGLDTCPDNLLLFFHHVPYTHVLQNGKTVIQHIYDSHFEGYEDVLQMSKLLNSLEGSIDSLKLSRMKERMKRQIKNAREWKDQINSYFHKLSWIDDDFQRKIY
ncbi:MAG: alpha-glucuronidase [Peptostreptococcaceae bacterium]|nr:alpha-glucuronidase [Peptostreptococcaceae bacterium]